MDTVEELIRATAEAREVIREMHAATKDLQQAVRKARYVINEELNRITNDVSSEIKQRVDAELDTLRNEVRAAVDNAVGRVQEDFVKLSEAQREFAQVMIGGPNAPLQP